MTNAIFNLLAEDQDLIVYRKSLNKITGGITSTILLQQMIYWYKKSGNQEFYKFRGPCAHQLYRPGDSWTEELGFSPAEFDTALSRIGTKITRGTSKAEAFNKTDATGLVIYWTDASRVTWYSLNVELLGNLGKSIYLENGVSEFTLKSDNPDLPLTETTAETTSENSLNKEFPRKTQQKQSQPKKRKLPPVPPPLEDFGPLALALMEITKTPYEMLTNGTWFNFYNTLGALVALKATDKQLREFLAWFGLTPSVNQITDNWGLFVAGELPRHKQYQKNQRSNNGQPKQSSGSKRRISTTYTPTEQQVYNRHTGEVITVVS